MSNAFGSIKDIDSSRVEALQGLLRSLDDSSDEAIVRTPPSPDQVQRLSERIKEILGDVEAPSQGPCALPSKLLNEEGLPIIDISEPVDGDPQLIASFPVPDQGLIPFSLLSSEEKERRRREHGRILDLLEEEERLQQLQEERDAEEERKDSVRRRKESAKAKLEQLKATQDLQKKMGHALVKGARERRRKDDMHSNPQNTIPSGKKSVSFAGVSPVEDDERNQQQDWGDVIPGRLCAQRCIPWKATINEEKSPLKMRVVERCPAGAPTPSLPSHADVDSDDESISTEDPHRLQDKSSDGDNTSSSTSDDLLDDGPLEEGFDYDIAQHHREVALEYHRKRDAAGMEVAKAMSEAILGDDDEQRIEATRGQLPSSSFRADHMGTVYDESHGPISMSIGQTLIPASRYKSLRNSVRLGKLENNRLVGGESGESGSEDETIREVTQMLQTGNMRNAGPNLESPSSSIALPQDSDTVGSSYTVGASIDCGPTLSKLKLAPRGGITGTNTVRNSNADNNTQPQRAISSVVERKTSKSFPINKPSPRSAIKSSEPAFPTIIDSPSFPATSQPSARDPRRSTSKFMAERIK